MGPQRGVVPVELKAMQIKTMRFQVPVDPMGAMRTGRISQPQTDPGGRGVAVRAAISETKILDLCEGWHRSS